MAGSEGEQLTTSSPGPVWSLGTPSLGRGTPPSQTLGTNPFLSNPFFGTPSPLGTPSHCVGTPPSQSSQFLGTPLSSQSLDAPSSLGRGTPPSKTLGTPSSQLSLPSQKHGCESDQQERSPARSVPGCLQPFSQASPAHQMSQEGSQQTSSIDSSLSSTQLSLPSQVHGEPNLADLSPDQFECQDTQSSSQIHLSDRLSLPDSPCSKPFYPNLSPRQAPTTSQESSSSTNSGEMSRVRQEIVAHERYMEKKLWKLDEEDREEEKRVLGFDARKEELRYQKDTGEETQRGWL